MAEKKQRGPGRRFKKGQTGNPNGSSARARNPALKKLSRLTAAEVAEIGAMLLTGKRDMLQQVGQDKDATLLEIGFAACMADAIQNKDFRSLDRMLDRVIGRAKETVEVSGRDGTPMALELAHRQMSEDEMRQRADELAKQRAEAGDD